MVKTRVIVAMGSVRLGDEFIFRTSEIFGAGYRGRTLAFEGQKFTVVGFIPRYVNNVVLRGPSGAECLLPLQVVETALQLALAATSRKNA